MKRFKEYLEDKSLQEKIRTKLQENKTKQLKGKGNKVEEDKSLVEQFTEFQEHIGKDKLPNIRSIQDDKIIKSKDGKGWVEGVLGDTKTFEQMLNHA